MSLINTDDKADFTDDFCRWCKWRLENENTITQEQLIEAINNPLLKGFFYFLWTQGYRRGIRWAADTSERIRNL